MLICIDGESHSECRHDNLGFSTKVFTPPLIAEREKVVLACGGHTDLRSRCVGPVATSDFGHIPPKAESADHVVAVCR